MITATCERCGAAYAAHRSSARFCGPACKKAAQRARRAAEGASVVDVEFRGPIEKAAHAELTGLDLLASVPGQVALVLARLLDRAGPAQGSSVAAWSKELARTMEDARKRAAARPSADDPVARGRARLAARRLGALPVDGA